MKLNTAIKKSRPTTPAMRQASFVTRKGLAKSKPHKSLTYGYKRSVGRDSEGRISSRHKGGGAKRKYRIIDTLENLKNGPFELVQFEYDPNRTARIALIKNTQGKYAYIIAPKDSKIGHKLEVGDKATVAPGNRLPLSKIPTGIEIHNIELTPNSKAKMVRSAGSKAVIMAHEGGYTLVKLPSSEIRKFSSACLASVGAIGNETHNAIKIGKAGRKRKMGIRPTVRGKAMSPNAHPHGGGEGGSSIGMKAPKTPWGKRTLGVKTRKRFDKGNFIVRPRRKKRK